MEKPRWDCPPRAAFLRLERESRQAMAGVRRAIQLAWRSAPRNAGAGDQQERAMPRPNQYTSGPILPGKRRPPPPELDAREAKIWREITGRLPAEWFTADNAPLLKELCRHIRHADDLSDDVTVARARINQFLAEPKRDPFKKLLLEATQEYLTLLRAHGFQSERIGNLSTKLRLTNQSRYQSSKAKAEAARTASSHPEPWLDWGSEVPESDAPDDANGPNRKQ
jgi:hypothetical protein